MVALDEDPHYKQTSEEIEKGHPCISLDYKIMGESDKDGDKFIVIVGRDRWMGHDYRACSQRQRSSR